MMFPTACFSFSGFSSGSSVNNTSIDNCAFTKFSRERCLVNSFISAKDWVGLKSAISGTSICPPLIKAKVWESKFSISGSVSGLISSSTSSTCLVSDFVVSFSVILRLIFLVKRDFAKGAGCQRQVQFRHRDVKLSLTSLFQPRHHKAGQLRHHEKHLRVPDC